ncbi:MAG: hypothetical protein MUF29_08210 [Chitinophagaceae bacterium]|nr:hypothetical protein [Chitinophagaceae bacterium]
MNSESTPLIHAGAAAPVPVELVRQELGRILQTRGFAGSPTLSKFLSFIVEQTLEGKTHEIKEYSVGVAVLGKPVTFNPMQDASVRVHAVRLRKLLAESYVDPEIQPAVRIELPKGSYLPVFSPWQSGNERHEPDHRSANRAATSSIPDETICVVPFKGFINYEAPDFSVDGFCQFLSEKLSHFQDIGVVSFYSVCRFFSEGGQMSDLSKKLGVGYYVSGSVELNGPDFLVSVQLFDALNNKIVWAQTFHSNIESGGLMKIVDDITAQIASSVAGYNGAVHVKRNTNNEHLPPQRNKLALAVFFAYNFIIYPSKENCIQAIEQLEQVLAGDPESALGWSILGHLYSTGYIHGFPVGANPLAQARYCVQRGLSISDHNQHAYLVLAWLHLLERDREMAIQYLEKADAINPNSSYFNGNISMCFGFLGEFERSAALLERAIILHPLPAWWMNMPAILISLKNHEYERMLFHASKINVVTVVYYQLFDMIALYYLEDRRALKAMLKEYRQRFPQGLAFCKRMLSELVFDENLRSQIDDALQAMEEMA